MPDHLRYAGADKGTQRQALIDIIGADEALMYLLEGLAALDLADGLLVSGALYNTVWNVLTGRPRLYGLKDGDVAYFHPSDLSYKAEDRVIQMARDWLAESPIPIEVRNQAWVHLWFRDKFGIDYPKLPKRRYAWLLLDQSPRRRGTPARWDDQHRCALWTQ